ncbi:MAG: hybrid sensor histidine kinase/response regulator, partial [Candidatus Rokuibacteriota bacterium]
LSHELRTPLNAVLGWAVTLRSGVLDAATAARALEAIERNARVQGQLIEDLLDISRIVTGKLRVDVRLVDLVTVVEAALDAVRPGAEAKGVRLQPMLDPRAGPISGDPDRLQQIVWNLLSNAIKFTPRDGRVHVRLERASSHVEIIVSDSGAGIPPEVLPYVFDRFRQADSTTTRSQRGLGIGLSLVKHLVELHGGSVHAASPGPGHGSTFTVKLPLLVRFGAREADRVHPTAGRSVPVTTTAVLTGVRTLVVDDAPDALELLEGMLTMRGAEVRGAASVAEALAILAEWRADVIVSDIEMPGEDGYALIRKLRARGRDAGGETPAVAVTAYGSVADRIRILSAGFNMHVPKPVEPAELIAVLANLVGRLDPR